MNPDSKYLDTKVLLNNVIVGEVIKLWAHKYYQFSIIITLYFPLDSSLQ